MFWELMLLALYLLIDILLLSYILGMKLGGPWIPVKKGTVESFLKVAQIKPGQKVYDLGCGDGRVVFACAKAGADAVGYEISLLPFLLACIKKPFVKNSSKAKILLKDFWKGNYGDADVVFLWLWPSTYAKIGGQLKDKFKKGCTVVAYMWPIPGWTPVLSESSGKSKFFVYEIS